MKNNKKMFNQPKVEIKEIKNEDIVLADSPTKFGGEEPGDNEYNFDSLFN